ncbi:substrate-binding domain-containing protein [Arcanobacterium buesumense]|uniref:Solute-binding protein n=1 Tax=Arcanobacterium buesumense TaxID=2722751 RepID=A0A6H2ELW6_9ACTO|nr:substrate-binding domain-containing protein [Arcanobacterium buesumense]QJC22066.1 solute-binding protein [Arcanobacterium buesumense]
MRTMIPRIIGVIVVFLLSFIGVSSTYNFNPDVMVLCSNNEPACQALVDDYTAQSHKSAQMVRMPTSEALAHLQLQPQKSEFDVWIGGPAEAYVLAERAGLLTAHHLDTDTIPSTMLTSTWIGTYGGVLAFCVAPDAPTPYTWADLAHYSGRLALPLPFSSGTAVTMLSVLHERQVSDTFYANLHRATTTYTASGTAPAQLVRRGIVDAAVTFEAYCPADSDDANAPQLIIPLDGTGYEIGAGAVLAHGRQAAGQDFLRYTISERGQKLLAQVEGQNPVSLALDNNLASRLAQLDVALYATDIHVMADTRQTMVDRFAHEVMYPYGVRGPLARSLSLAVVGATLAAIFGASFAILYRISARYRLAILLSACAPILVPSVAIATALTVHPVNIDPYGGLIIILTFALCATPIAFLTCLVFTADLTAEKIMSAADMGSSPGRIIHKLYFPRIQAGVAVSIVGISLWLVSDNSAGAVYGGRDHLFINMVLSSVSSDRQTYTMLAWCVIIGAIGAITTWYFLAYRDEHRAKISIRQMLAGDNSRAIEFLHRFFVKQRRYLLCVEVLWLSIVLYVVIIMATYADFSALPDDFQARIAMKLWIGFAVTAVAVIIGVSLAIHEWAYTRWLRAFMAFLLLGAPIGVGLLLTLMLRNNVEVAGYAIFPALVGSYSIGGGTIAVIIAYLTLAIPLAYFFAVMMMNRMAIVARTARDIGANRLRVLFLVLWQMKGRFVALVAIVFGLTLTQTATLAFVQPAYLLVSSTNLVNLAERGDVGEVFATSLLTGGLAALIIIAGSMALISARYYELKGSR